MSKVSDFLTQPSPQAKPWHQVAISTLIVAFILMVLQPFGLDRVEEGKIKLMFGYVLVTAICSIIVVYLFPFLFKRYYTVNWTFGKSLLNILLIVFLIILGNTLYSYIFFHGFVFKPYILSLYLKAQLFITLSVACIVILVIILFNHMQALKKNLKEAQELNIRLISKEGGKATLHNSPLITLSGATKESVMLHPEELLYIESYGNYIKVFYRHSREIKQAVIRTPIKKAEEALSDYPMIVRCHRAFIVNTEQVISVKGNSQGYQLILKDNMVEIPVSRAYTKAIHELLNQ